MPRNSAAEALLASFNDPANARRYGDGPHRFIPGMVDLHRMVGVLLAERTPERARVLVLGAGGGLELKVLADTYPDWTFVGVDPARAMLDEARRVLGSNAPRVTFCEGYIDDAPEGPFDGAVCLLTLHFLDSEERTRTAREVRRRLKPGTPFATAHCSFPQREDRRAIWLSRYAAFALSSGANAEQVAKMCAAMDAHLPLLDPDQDEALLRAAGFSDVELFYAAFTWRGWVGYA